MSISARLLQNTTALLSSLGLSMNTATVAAISAPDFVESGFCAQLAAGLVDIVRKICVADDVNESVTATSSQNKRLVARSPALELKKVDYMHVAKRLKVEKAIDFSAYHSHQVMVHVLYLGWNMSGLAMQHDSDIDNSVERRFFDAVNKIKLIPNMTDVSYSRCGRTDKGVSAFGQILSIRFRGIKIVTPADNAGISLPDYAKMLNSVLGKDSREDGWKDGEVIRIAGCRHVADRDNVSDRPISARFDCEYRTYRYYFVKAYLDIPAMQQAAQHLVGEHDFRNLCKLDYSQSPTVKYDDNQDDTVNNCQAALPKAKTHKPTIRFIHSAAICDALPQKPVHCREDDRDVVMYIEIKGKAFLWHQIRCIMSVLFLVGLNREQPEIIRALLDCDVVRKKPLYSPARALPLALWHCHYPSRLFFDADDEAQDYYSGDTSSLFPMSESALSMLLRDLCKLYMEYLIKATMIKNMIMEFKFKCPDFDAAMERATSEAFVKTFIPTEGVAMQYNTYVPLLKRT